VRAGHLHAALCECLQLLQGVCYPLGEPVRGRARCVAITKSGVLVEVRALLVSRRLTGHGRKALLIDALRDVGASAASRIYPVSQWRRVIAKRGALGPYQSLLAVHPASQPQVQDYRNRQDGPLPGKDERPVEKPRSSDRHDSGGIRRWIARSASIHPSAFLG